MINMKNNLVDAFVLYLNYSPEDCYMSGGYNNRQFAEKRWNEAVDTLSKATGLDKSFIHIVETRKDGYMFEADIMVEYTEQVEALFAKALKKEQQEAMEELEEIEAEIKKAKEKIKNLKPIELPNNPSLLSYIIEKATERQR
jgi:ribosome-associated translation inhibitor RaiA